MSPVKNPSSSKLYKQISKVFDPLLFCFIRSSIQTEPCSGLWTTWNLRVLPQKKHNHRVGNQIPHSLLLSTYILLPLFCKYVSCIMCQISSCLHSILILPCSINYIRRDPWHFEKHVRERGRVPCECPSVSLSEQQAHTLPCARGESAMGGISHIFPPQNHQLHEKVVWVYWIQFVFHVLFCFQVSFSSYMPTYYASEDSGDHVDGYALTMRWRHLMFCSYTARCGEIFAAKPVHN